jgi:hypothetical protein
MYEMIACNFHFNFIPKELLYVKNSSSKYELNLEMHTHARYGVLRHVTETAGVPCIGYGTEGLSLRITLPVL